MNRLPIVGVMGSGTESHSARASKLGAWLATLEVHLLTGGGGGVMESVSRAFYGVNSRKGLVIGIIPAKGSPGTKQYAGPDQDYPNRYVEVPIYTQLYKDGKEGADILSRNHINILTPRVLVAFPGSAGTASEVRLAYERYHKPIIAYVDRATDIPGLPQSVVSTPEFEKIQSFIVDALSRNEPEYPA